MGKETGGRYTLIKVLESEGEAFWVLLEGEMTFEVGDDKGLSGFDRLWSKGSPSKNRGRRGAPCRRRSRLLRRRWSS